MTDRVERRPVRRSGGGAGTRIAGVALAGVVLLALVGRLTAPTDSDDRAVIAPSPPSPSATASGHPADARPTPSSARPIAPSPFVRTSPVRRLVVAGPDDAWGNERAGALWRQRADRWSPLRVAGWPWNAHVAALARTPEGAIVVATDRGVALLADGRWEVVLEGIATAVAVGPDGLIWTARWTSAAERGAGMGMETLAAPALRVASFRRTTAGWARRELPPLVPGGTAISLAVDGFGDAWLGSGGATGTLDRFDGRRWRRVELPEGGVSVADLAVDPSGTVWAAAVAGVAPEWRSVLLELGRDGLAVHPTPKRPAGWTPSAAFDGDPAALPAGLLLANATDLLAFDGLGRAYLMTLQGLVRFDGRRWVRLGPAPAADDPEAGGAPIAADPGGDVWSWDGGRIVRAPRAGVGLREPGP